MVLTIPDRRLCTAEATDRRLDLRTKAPIRAVDVKLDQVTAGGIACGGEARDQIVVASLALQLNKEELVLVQPTMDSRQSG